MTAHDLRGRVTGRPVRLRSGGPAVLLPGLALAAAGVAAAVAGHRLLPAVPMLTLALLLGIAAAHVPPLRTAVEGAARPGLTCAGKRLMRAGVVLLGLELVIGDVLAVGWRTVGVVVAVVAVTFAGTLWLGRRLRLPGDQPLLLATGASICGASAIGAVGAARRSDERDAAVSVALVTLCGTLAILVLPLLQQPLGLDDGQFGRWAGAGVHDVGQVVATAGTAGPQALTEAVLVKLMRVALLAPLVAAVAVSVRRRGRAGEDGPRPPAVPLFVVGFLVMVVVRSAGVLPPWLLETVGTGRELLLAAALFGLGSAVRLPLLVRSSGPRAALVALSSWAVIAAAAYAGVLLTT